MNFVVRDPARPSLQALFQSSGVDGVRARTPAAPAIACSRILLKVVAGVMALGSILT
jgi:hypothetical protein